MLARLFRPPGPEPNHPFLHFLQRFQPVGYPIPPASELELRRCEALLGVPLPESLRTLYRTQNGGYFNGGLLHVLGACRALRHADLATWNQPQLWKATFADLPLSEYLFFADDPFGNQFGIRLGEATPAVHRFDIQHGEFQEMAPSLADFFNLVLVNDGTWLLGADFLEQFTESCGEWQVGQHLAQVIPSLLSGSLAAENLRPMDPWVNLYMCGQIVTQVKPLPPGTEVRGFTFHPDTLTLELNVSRP